MKPLPTLCTWPAARLAQALQRGEISAVTAVQAYLDAIALRDGDVHAYLEVFSQEALEQAAASDERRAQGRPLSPLDGVPVALKDNLCVKGHVCSCASAMLASYVSPYDATVVRRLRDAGLPILGRLNMDEFAMGGSTEHSAFGPTRNPWKLSHVPGGSSGGSAAAVAAGLAPWALGSDTGGSIRQPAAFCGVVGVKPAYGAVSRYGLVAFASSLDQIGPLTRDVRDAALLLDVLCGPDERDMTSDPALSHGYADGLNADVRGLRVGLPAECLGDGLDARALEAVQNAAEALRRRGVQVREVSVPSLSAALPAYYVLSSAEASSNLARFDGVRYGRRAQAYGDLEELYRQSRSEGLGPEVKRRILLGAYALSSGYQDRYYLKALQVRDLVRHDLARALEECVVLLGPVAPTPAYRLGERAGDPLRMYLGDVYTVPANIAGLPALSVPRGVTHDGLPLGVHLLGGRNGLATLLRAALALETPLDGAPYAQGGVLL